MVAHSLSTAVHPLNSYWHSWHLQLLLSCSKVGGVCPQPVMCIYAGNMQSSLPQGTACPTIKVNSNRQSALVSSKHLSLLLACQYVWDRSAVLLSLAALQACPVSYSPWAAWEQPCSHSPRPTAAATLLKANERIIGTATISNSGSHRGRRMNSGGRTAAVSAQVHALCCCRVCLTKQTAACINPKQPLRADAVSWRSTSQQHQQLL